MCVWCSERPESPQISLNVDEAHLTTTTSHHAQGYVAPMRQARRPAAAAGTMTAAGTVTAATMAAAACTVAAACTAAAGAAAGVAAVAMKVATAEPAVAGTVAADGMGAASWRRQVQRHLLCVCVW